MAIKQQIIAELLSDYKNPEDLLGAGRRCPAVSWPARSLACSLVCSLADHGRASVQKAVRTPKCGTMQDG